MLDRLMGAFMVERGLMTKNQLDQVIKAQESNRAKLGVVAVSEKLMTIAQAEQVNALQASMDMRFGDIAVEKGYLTDAQVERLLKLQGNSYMAFVQAVVDLGILPMEKIPEIEKEYETYVGATAIDMVELKTDNIDNIVPLFLHTGNKTYKSIFSMAIKALYRLVDTHVYIGKTYTVDTVREEVIGYQHFHGDVSGVLAISGKYENIKKMAIAYTKEEFIETREDALDAICELINCINGLYATEESKKEVKLELNPPDFSVAFQGIDYEGIVVMPVYISGGEIKLTVRIV